MIGVPLKLTRLMVFEDSTLFFLVIVVGLFKIEVGTCVTSEGVRVTSEGVLLLLLDTNDVIARGLWSEAVAGRMG